MVWLIVNVKGVGGALGWLFVIGTQKRSLERLKLESGDNVVYIMTANRAGAWDLFCCCFLVLECPEDRGSGNLYGRNVLVNSTKIGMKGYRECSGMVKEMGEILVMSSPLCSEIGEL